MPVLNKLSLAIQFWGGWNRGSTESAPLYVVAAIDVARARNFSCGASFTDLQTAFASIARMIAFPAPSSMDSFVAKLLSAGFSKEQAHEIAEGIAAYDYWIANGGSQRYLMMLSKLHTR